MEPAGIAAVTGASRGIGRAVAREHLPVEETPLELWREMFETNVFGLVEVTRRAIPLVRAAGGGVICNMGSSSILAPVPFYAAYRASKAAVSALSETLRAELAPQHIRVVEIMPGPVDSDMLRHSQTTMVGPEGDAYQALAD